MARTVDQAARHAKREAILDHAAQLIRTIGYERMSIRDLIDGLGISRGALYHYFDSKQAVLEALVDRMGTQAAEALLPIIEDPQLTALQKFHRYVGTEIEIKAGNRELIADLLQGWYSEENLRVRHKLSVVTLDQTVPMILEPIIRQGVAEHTFDTRYPAEAARIVAQLWLGLADSLIMLTADAGQDDVIMERAGTLLAASTDAIERILGAPPKALDIGPVGELFRLSRPRKASATAGGKDN